MERVVPTVSLEHQGDVGTDTTSTGALDPDRPGQAGEPAKFCRYPFNGILHILFIRKILTYGPSREFSLLKRLQFTQLMRHKCVHSPVFSSNQRSWSSAASILGMCLCIFLRCCDEYVVFFFLKVGKSCCLPSTQHAHSWIRSRSNKHWVQSKDFSPLGRLQCSFHRASTYVFVPLIIYRRGPLFVLHCPSGDLPPSARESNLH